MLFGNVKDEIPEELPDELVSTLVERHGVRIERIVSRGHASPADFWYEQTEHELVLLIQGAARILIEGEGERALSPGDWLDIPARMRHRVTWTAPGEDTIWLAVFQRACEG